MPNNAKLPTRCICGAVASDALLNNLQTTVCSCNNFKLLQPKGKLSRQNWIKGNMKLFSVSQLPSKWMRIYVRMAYIWQGWQEALSGPKFAHVQLLTMSNGTEEHKTFYVVIQTQVSRFVQFGCLLQTPSDLERQKDTLYHHSAPLAVWDIVYIKFHSILCLKPNNHQEDDEKPVENWRLSYLLPLINFLDWIK